MHYASIEFQEQEQMLQQPLLGSYKLYFPISFYLFQPFEVKPNKITQ